MAELREAHLRYLLAIYELGKSTPDVGTQAVAKALNCSKASVTKMMATLMDMNLLVRERYGKGKKTIGVSGMNIKNVCYIVLGCVWVFHIVYFCLGVKTLPAAEKAE